MEKRVETHWRKPFAVRPRAAAGDTHPLLALQRQAGNAAVAARAAATVQRVPKKPAATAPQEPEDPFFDGLRVAKGALDLSLDVILSEPLTSEEMQELLLIRRAEPLSVPASTVNTAGARRAAIDGDVRQVDTATRKAATDLKELQTRRRSARGEARQLIGLEISKLKGEAATLAARRKLLLAERVRLVRGQRLGTPGLGAPAGTGQITYASIQVIDARGRRIALEQAETSATEHAEEVIVGRLRARFARDQLRGARLVVVTDQVVCDGRCRPALVAFAEDYQLESVESRIFVRSRIDGKGTASPRTTMRTATQASSAGLPVVEEVHPIYQRPPTTEPSVPPTRPPAPGLGPRAVDVAGEESARAGRRPTVGDLPVVPVGARMRTTMMEAGGNLLVDLVMDLLVAKYQQWRNEVNLRERLAALQPQVERAKLQALQGVLSDPWAGGTKGKFYNVYLKITATTTTAIGGGHAVVIPGSPRPSLLTVTISGEDANRLISESEATKVPRIRDGATGALVELKDQQLVVYSEPVP